MATNKEGAIWLFDAAANSFVSLDTQSGQAASQKAVTLASSPVKIIFDGEGRLWFIEQSRQTIGSFEPSSGQLKEFPLASDASLADLAVASGNQVWLTDAGRNKLIKVEKGWLTEYTIPTSYSSPQGIAVDETGGVWFAESMSNKIGLLREGHFEEYAVPTALGQPGSLGLDRQGNLWFIEHGSSKLGHIGAETLRRFSSSLAQRVEQLCAPPPAEPPNKSATPPVNSQPNGSQPTQEKGEQNVNRHGHNQD
jgi:virginiamycin B lyase